MRVAHAFSLVYDKHVIANTCFATKGGAKKKKHLNVMHIEALQANEVEQHDDENQNTSGTYVVRSISFVLTALSTSLKLLSNFFKRLCQINVGWVHNAIHYYIMSH
jgi:hypothetical protein